MRPIVASQQIVGIRQCRTDHQKRAAPPNAAEIYATSATGASLRSLHRICAGDRPGKGRATESQVISRPGFAQRERFPAGGTIGTSC
jgi:hypothetical protein